MTKPEFTAAAESESDVEGADAMYLDGDRFYSPRYGWRYFTCDTCGEVWRSNCRDCWSQSSEICLCGETVYPDSQLQDSSQAALENIDKHGNVKVYHVETLRSGNDLDTSAPEPVFTGTTQPFCPFCQFQAIATPGRPVFATGEHICGKCGRVFYIEQRLLPLYNTYMENPLPKETE